MVAANYSTMARQGLALFDPQSKRDSGELIRRASERIHDIEPYLTLQLGDAVANISYASSRRSIIPVGFYIHLHPLDKPPQVRGDEVVRIDAADGLTVSGLLKAFDTHSLPGTIDNLLVRHNGEKYFIELPFDIVRAYTVSQQPPSEVLPKCLQSKVPLKVKLKRGLEVLLHR